MIPPSELHAFVRAVPFVPFRINLTDGRHFDVRHPDLIMVGLSTAIVGIPRAGDEAPFYERTVTVSLFHVVSAEPLPAPQASAGS